MRGGGNQIGDVASGLSAARDDDRLHVMRVAGKDFDPDARHDLAVAASNSIWPEFTRGS